MAAGVDPFSLEYPCGTRQNAQLADPRAHSFQNGPFFLARILSRRHDTDFPDFIMPTPQWTGGREAIDSLNLNRKGRRIRLNISAH